MRLYLASRSPRRRELLTQMGVAFDTLIFRSGMRSDPEVDESTLAGFEHHVLGGTQVGARVARLCVAGKVRVVGEGVDDHVVTSWRSASANRSGWRVLTSQ